MNVLLVLPYLNFDETKYLSSRDSAFPIGMGYLAAALRAAGHTVSVFDFQVRANTLAAFAALAKAGDFDAVGFSAVTVTKSSILKLARIVKDARPSVSVICGGPFTTVYPGQLLSDSDAVDIEVIGEGEQTMPEALAALSARTDLSAVAGIAYREGRAVQQTQPRPLIADLDAIPFPDRSLFDLDAYTPPPGMFFRLPLRHMITTRGCPFNCVYCDDRVIWRGKCRMRSPANIAAEMDELQGRYGAREIHFYDDTFTVRKGRILALCDMLAKKKKRVIWRCSARTDTVTPEMLKAMYAAGCRSISYGIESGDDGMLQKMQKGTTVAQAREAVRWTRRARIQAKGFFMLNFPGDTVETTEKTIALAKELDLDFAGFNFTIPLHGSRLRAMVEGVYPLNEKIYHDSQAKEGNSIYFFQPQLPEEYLRKVYARVVREFYLRPRYMIKMLASIRNPDMAKSYCRGFARLFKIKAL